MEYLSQYIYFEFYTNVYNFLHIFKNITPCCDANDVSTQRILEQMSSWC